MAWTEEEDANGVNQVPLNKEEAESTASGKKGATEGKDAVWFEMMEKVLGATVIEQRRARRWKIFFRFVYLLVFVGIGVGLFWGQQEHESYGGGQQVAVVPMVGVIGSGAEVDANEYVALLQDVYADPRTKAVLIEMNSPGGSPVHADILYQFIVSQRQRHPDIPVVVAVEDLAASGGYYIAAAADEIYANPASLVGSIGVISAGFDATGLMEKLGIKRRLFTAGENKGFMDPFSPMSEQTPAHWQGVLNDTHKRFIDAVRQGRGERLKEDASTFSGLVFSGDGALALGLIDGFDYSANMLATRFANLEPVYYEPAKDPWEQVAKEFGVSFTGSVLNLLRW